MEEQNTIEQKQEKITSNSTARQIKSPNKKRGVIYILLIILIGASTWGGASYLKKREQAGEKEKFSQTSDLSEQFRRQLPDLEEKSKSNAPSDLQNYGVALYATGNLAKAEEVYKKQIAVDANNAMAHNNLANTLRDEKKIDEAIVEYENAIKLSPKSLNTYVNLGSIYQYSLSDIDKAIEIYKRGIVEISTSADLDVLVALAYEQKNNPANAAIYFQKALDIQSDNQAAKAGLERANSNK